MNKRQAFFTYLGTYTIMAALFFLLYSFSHIAFFIITSLLVFHFILQGFSLDYAKEIRDSYKKENKDDELPVLPFSNHITKWNDKRIEKMQQNKDKKDYLKALKDKELKEKATSAIMASFGKKDELTQKAISEALAKSEISQNTNTNHKISQ